MAGNINSDSVIWVVGEATGKSQTGATATIPSSHTASGIGTQAELDALETRLVASGVIPNANF